MIRSITLSSLLLAASATAQFSFNTGSPELDADLNSINVSAKIDPTRFNADLSVEFSVDGAKIEGMIVIGMEPAEVYFALQIAQATSKPIDDVLTAYRTHKADGWGKIAQELGIKPGSPEFHALKASASGKKDKTKGNSGNAGGKNK